jgi:hypothetical protein
MACTNTILIALTSNNSIICVRTAQGNICNYKRSPFSCLLTNSCNYHNIIPFQAFFYHFLLTILADVSNQTQASLARPEVVPLQTTNTCARWQHEVTISLPASQNDSSRTTTSAAQGSQQQNPVTFLLKLSSQDGSFVRYIWQVTFHF